MSRYLLTNATIVTGESSFPGSIGIDGGRISEVWKEGMPVFPDAEVIDLKGKVLMAGGIDAHVHFREPGLTWKADIASESAAAVLGGITSFVDMPNTLPPTVSIEALEGKLAAAALSSRANYGFHLGATNTNTSLIKEYLENGQGDRFGGIKVFMGSSTGNMLVDRDATLEEIFSIKGKAILVHCEDEDTVKANLEAARNEYGSAIPFPLHPTIRSREACIKSTGKALDLAFKHGTRLHILHVSTAEEVEMIREAKRTNPNISAETSANYLWFSDEDYPRLAGRIKCNPAIKANDDRDALLEGFSDGTIDTIGSDHAPHLLSEKEKAYAECPSGVPSVRHSLQVVLTLALKSGIPLTRVASAFSENVARILGIEGRGFIRKGDFADLVVLDLDQESVADGKDYKCGWTPYEGCILRGKAEMVWLNGIPVVSGSRMCAGIGLFQPLPLQFRPIG